MKRVRHFVVFAIAFKVIVDIAVVITIELRSEVIAQRRLSLLVKEKCTKRKTEKNEKPVALNPHRVKIPKQSRHAGKIVYIFSNGLFYLVFPMA